MIFNRAVENLVTIYPSQPLQNGRDQEDCCCREARQGMAVTLLDFFCAFARFYRRFHRILRMFQPH